MLSFNSIPMANTVITMYRSLYFQSKIYIDYKKYYIPLRKLLCKNIKEEVLSFVNKNGPPKNDEDYDILIEYICNKIITKGLDIKSRKKMRSIVIRYLILTVGPVKLQTELELYDRNIVHMNGKVLNLNPISKEKICELHQEKLCKKISKNLDAYDEKLYRKAETKSEINQDLQKKYIKMYNNKDFANFRKNKKYPDPDPLNKRSRRYDYQWHRIIYRLLSYQRSN